MILMENECKVTLFKIIHRSYCEKAHDYKIYFTLSNLTKRIIRIKIDTKIDYKNFD